MSSTRLVKILAKPPDTCDTVPDRWTQIASVSDYVLDLNGAHFKITPMIASSSVKGAWYEQKIDTPSQRDVIPRPFGLFTSLPSIRSPLSSSDLVLHALGSQYLQEPLLRKMLISLLFRLSCFDPLDSSLVHEYEQHMCSSIWSTNALAGIMHTPLSPSAMPTLVRASAFKINRPRSPSQRTRRFTPEDDVVAPPAKPSNGARGRGMLATTE
nr:hypothetical protein CFP56_21159 [Quercus suber]